ncbi:MAG TPA: hypothetical protein VGI10_01520 [Polyangiaceae bacterium]|jgi:hypothetical protein
MSQNAAAELAVMLRTSGSPCSTAGAFPTDPDSAGITRVAAKAVDSTPAAATEVSFPYGATRSGEYTADIAPAVDGPFTIATLSCPRGALAKDLAGSGGP